MSSKKYAMKGLWSKYRQSALIGNTRKWYDWWWFNCNIKTVTLRCSIEKVFQKQSPKVTVLWRKVFLEISQNSQENTCVRVSFLIKLQALKKRLWHRCFPVNFVKFLRAPTEHLLTTASSVSWFCIFNQNFSIKWPWEGGLIKYEHFLLNTRH